MGTEKNYGFCKTCGKLEQLIHELCSKCHQEERNDLKEIKEFIAKHPHANAMDVSRETGISISKITRLLR